MRILMSALLLLGTSQVAVSQCAPGVPSAGNPGCIPPNQQNSPYYHGDSQRPEVTQPQARWENRWGAIAVDLALAQGGTSVGQTSEASASREAVSRCISNGGKNCEVLQVFKNQCAAVVQPSDGGPLSTATAATEQEALSRAISRCGRGDTCQMIFKECSLPERVQ